MTGGAAVGLLTGDPCVVVSLLGACGLHNFHHITHK